MIAEPRPLYPDAPATPARVVYEVTDAQLSRIAIDAARAVMRELSPVPSFPDRALNQRELARMLGVGTATIRQWERDGALTGDDDGNAKRYAPETIAAFLRRRMEDGAR